MAKDKMLLYGGLALGAWLFLSRRGSALGGARVAYTALNGTYMIAPSDYVVFDIHGNIVSVNTTLSAAQQSASTWGGYGAVNTIKTGGPNWSTVSQYSVGSGSTSSDPTGNGWDWDPTHSPYFGDVVSGIGSFFGL